jgi:inorganic triphosphatase YgiF
VTGGTNEREIELKLILDHPGDAMRIVVLLESLGYGITPGERVRNEDLYLDTSEWTLMKSGFALRFRRVNGRRFYTVKGVGAIEEGLADRFELEVPVRREVGDPTVIPRGRVRSRIEPLIRPRRLIEQVMVRTERRLYRLSGGKNIRIELAFDASRFRAPGPNARRSAPRLYEMEAELVKGDPSELAKISRHVTERFACRPSVKSKLEVAMDRLGILVPSK